MRLFGKHVSDTLQKEKLKTETATCSFLVLGWKSAETVQKWVCISFWCPIMIAIGLIAAV